MRIIYYVVFRGTWRLVRCSNTKYHRVYSVDAQNWRRFRWNDKARSVNVRSKLYLPMCNTCDVQNEKSHFRQPRNIYKIHVIMYRYYVTYTIILYTDDMGGYYFIYFGIDFQKELHAPHAVHFYSLCRLHCTTATF